MGEGSGLSLHLVRALQAPAHTTIMPIGGRWRCGGLSTAAAGATLATSSSSAVAAFVRHAPLEFVHPPPVQCRSLQESLPSGSCRNSNSRRNFREGCRGGMPSVIPSACSGAATRVAFGHVAAAVLGCASTSAAGVVRRARMRRRRHFPRVEAGFGRSGLGAVFRAAVREEELLSMTVSVLKDMCRERSLKLSGKKQDLVRRILGHEAEIGEEEAEEADPEPQNEEEDGNDDGNYEEVAEEELERESSLWKANPTQVFVEALERDEVDEQALEDIFRIQRPQPGEIVKGVATSLTEFGVFVELDESGWTGLIHISEISDTYVENIEDYIRVGQKVEALVIKGGMDRLDRLSLSLRRLQDPTSVETNYKYSSLPPPGQRASSSRFVFGRRDPVAESLRRLEVRIVAIEGVLLQLGHGQALRAAQEAARAGVSRPVLPSVETLVSGLPPVFEEERHEKQVQSEKQNIDRILSEMMGDEDDSSSGRGSRDSKQHAAAASEYDDDDYDSSPMMNGGFGSPSGEAYETASIRQDDQSGSAGYTPIDPSELGDKMGEKYF